MPTTDTILWAAIAGLIMLMLAVIGYLIRQGFEGLKEQLQAIWAEVKGHRLQVEALSVEIAAIKARCKALHGD